MIDYVRRDACKVACGIDLAWSSDLKRASKSLEMGIVELQAKYIH